MSTTAVSFLGCGRSGTCSSGSWTLLPCRSYKSHVVLVSEPQFLLPPANRMYVSPELVNSVELEITVAYLEASLKFSIKVKKGLHTALVSKESQWCMWSPASLHEEHMTKSAQLVHTTMPWLGLQPHRTHPIRRPRLPNTCSCVLCSSWPPGMTQPTHQFTARHSAQLTHSEPTSVSITL